MVESIIMHSSRQFDLLLFVWAPFVAVAVFYPSLEMKKDLLKDLVFLLLMLCYIFRIFSDG